jgi:hypothetical protein
VTDPTITPNCYLCSPTTAYIDYALAELQAVDLPNAIKSVARAVVRICAPLVRATGLDAQIQVNNWMMSTNPVPDLSSELVETIKDTCIAMHPNRAIVIRSLNDVWDTTTIKTLRRAGFKLLAARQIYLLPKGATQTHRDVKRDAKMLAQSPFELIEGVTFSDTDFDRCEALYSALYLDKYTQLNPHYTALFLRELHERGVMRLVALRSGDAGIVGFTGLFETAGTLTQPFVGYDITRPQQDGIYRMLMHIGRTQAQSRGLDYNMSAGAAHFKRNRGAIAAIEYTAVYVAHRPWKMRAATAALQFVSRTIGVALVRKVEE